MGSMKSQEEYDRKLRQIEDQISQREAKYRGKSGDRSQYDIESQVEDDVSGSYENKDSNIQFYRTTKVKDRDKNGEKSPLLKSRAILGVKLVGLAIVAVIVVQVASFVATSIIVAALVFAGYKLFFDKPKK
jgi:hypothetical protein